MNSFYRGRRLRRTQALREFSCETHVTPVDLIQPYFIIPGNNQRVAIDSMPGVERLSPDLLAAEAEAIYQAGIPAILLFGVIEESEKDSQASYSHSPQGVIQEAIHIVKQTVPDLVVITDVCLCAYTDHGHCGLLDHNGHVINDDSLPVLAEMALSHAIAGADIVAPSDMMDGRVRAIRHLLDKNGFSHTPILSYAAKYASAFYGPFRDAAKSGMKKGETTRAGYQMDPPNAREALREIQADINEGADMVMVKPGLPYLDIIRATRDRFDVPVVAYNVSGEYSMIKAAAMKGWLDENVVVQELLTSIKRAGADKIISYFAKGFAGGFKTS